MLAVWNNVAICASVSFWLSAYCYFVYILCVWLGCFSFNLSYTIVVHFPLEFSAFLINLYFWMSAQLDVMMIRITSDVEIWINWEAIEMTAILNGCMADSALDWSWFLWNIRRTSNLRISTTIAKNLDTTTCCKMWRCFAIFQRASIVLIRSLHNCLAPTISFEQRANNDEPDTVSARKNQFNCRFSCYRIWILNVIPAIARRPLASVQWPFQQLHSDCHREQTQSHEMNMNIYISPCHCKWH